MKNNNKTGFTLVEVIVAVTVFTIIIGIVMLIFSWVIETQEKTLASQELLFQTSFLMEHMGKSLRMAKKELSHPPTQCLDTVGRGFNFETNPPINNRIRFINDDNLCQEFFLSGARLKKRISTNDNADRFKAPLYLTPPYLEVVSFRVNLIGAGQIDTLGQIDRIQPRVTLFLEIRRAGPKPGLLPSVKIQTTLSQRDLDIVK
ncbi:MAG: prepilin-type N-terminal cleavage/methylation domain-containing protein [Candidatus Nealsonbacteria bacterium]|nr:prepilin-type N-terminal cleavage/methylation domain-containing protein [Candidatus Nealsonbacteria bacterium]